MKKEEVRSQSIICQNQILYLRFMQINADNKTKFKIYFLIMVANCGQFKSTSKISQKHKYIMQLKNCFPLLVEI